MTYRHPRDVQVVGAGLGGLFIATALAQRGWEVRVHEQAADLRMFGAGIWLWENGLRSLENIGAYDRATYRAQRMSAWEIRDRDERLIRRRETPPWDRLIVPPRADVYEALISGAKDAGVEIVTDSKAVAASPEGTVTFSDGSTESASLVVAADGIRSRIRESLGLTAWLHNLGNGAIRLLIEREPDEGGDISSENWAGNRGLLYNPCSDEHVYICMVCPQSDERGRAVPVDRESWSESHPRFASVIARIGDQGRWDDFAAVKARSWSSGRVAIIGDAAHGQPPWLGQAANLAFANALALADVVTGLNDVPQALRSWERAMRPMTDHTERWSNSYGRVVGLWPDHMERMRSRTVRTFVRLPYVEAMLNRAQHATIPARTPTTMPR